MMPLDVLLAFLGVAFLIGIAPGPDNIFVLTQSAIAGSRAGILVTLGLCTGILIHTTAVAFGVAAVFAASALAFTLLKITGAAYLLFLAYKAFREPTGPMELGRTRVLSSGEPYRRGIILNLTNPKIIIFFLALLPQFADPARGPLAPQVLLLGVCFVGTTVIVFFSIALLSGRIGALLRRSGRAQRVLNLSTAAVFVGLAARLALVED